MNRPGQNVGLSRRPGFPTISYRGKGKIEEDICLCRQGSSYRESEFCQLKLKQKVDKRKSEGIFIR